MKHYWEDTFTLKMLALGGSWHIFHVFIVVSLLLGPGFTVGLFTCSAQFLPDLAHVGKGTPTALYLPEVQTQQL